MKSPRRGALVLAAGALLLSAHLVTAVPATPIKEIPPELFTPVAVLPDTPGSPQPLDVAFVPSLAPPLPEPPLPTSTPRPRPTKPPRTSTPRPAKTPSSTSSIRGVASWYCGHGSRCTRGHPGGLYAAIRRDLLYLRGKQVTVVYGTKRVRVTIIDCNCGPHANLIDLYSDAFARLAPLSSGRITVRLLFSP